MDRRSFLRVAAVGVLAGPLAGEAQQVARPTIGILDLGSAANMRNTGTPSEQALSRTYTNCGLGLKILVSAVQSHPERAAFAFELDEFSQ
jgi:hypothetical protein